MRAQVDDFVLGVLAFEDLDAVEQFVTIIAEVGLERSFAKLESHLPKISDPAIFAEVKEFIAECPELAHDPFFEMRKFQAPKP